MKTSTETWTLEARKPAMMRAAFVPTLVRVTNDPDHVDEQTALAVDIDDTTNILAAKIGGAPFLSTAAPAPKCGKCKQPLRFVLQLRRSDLPPAARAALSDELLQMFWCDDCQSEGGAENPWSKGALIREVALASPLAPVSTNDDDDDDDDDDALVVIFIRDWTEVADYPVSLVKELAVALGVSPKSAAMRERLEALGEAMSAAELGPQEGLKIGGWPRWVSEPEAVKCKCKAAMTPILQLGDVIAVGDGGSTWIFACAACGLKAYLCQQ